MWNEIRVILHKIPMLHNFCVKYIQYLNRKFYVNLDKSRCIGKLKLEKLPRKTRCFIIGNGPSLNSNDLDKLVNEDCFAANLIFNIFNKTNWRPRYYFIQDRYARVGNFINDNQLCYVFIGDYFWRTREVLNNNAFCYHTERILSNEVIRFSLNPAQGLFDVGTVTYTMLQVAINMGYKEIYLLGIDHNYPFTYDEHGNVVVNNINKGHFFKDENPTEVIANVLMMEKGYIKAKKVSEKLGIKIYNVTRGGKLEIFERLDLDDLMK